MKEGYINKTDYRENVYVSEADSGVGVGAILMLVGICIIGFGLHYADSKHQQDITEASDREILLRTAVQACVNLRGQWLQLGPDKSFECFVPSANETN